MPIIFLQIEILASPAVCFNLSRSIDLHVKLMKDNGEGSVLVDEK